MILAGDIGGTKSNLALMEKQGDRDCICRNADVGRDRKAGDGESSE